MQSRTSGNRFMTIYGDNIPNGFCQTANPRCAMSTRRGSWICSHLCPAYITTTDRMAARHSLDRRRDDLCGDALRKRVSFRSRVSLELAHLAPRLIEQPPQIELAFDVRGRFSTFASLQ